MKKTSEELIAEHYKNNVSNYPGISLEQAKEICHGPWEFLKKEMQSGELSEVRFKYFGTFQVYPGRAKNMLISLKERFKMNKVNREWYFKTKKMLEKLVENHEKKV